MIMESQDNRENIKVDSNVKRAIRSPKNLCNVRDVRSGPA